MLTENQIRELAENSAASVFRAIEYPPTSEEFERMWQLIANAMMAGMTNPMNAGLNEEMDIPHAKNRKVHGNSK